MSEKNENLIAIKNARCVYPSLFETETFNGEDTGKYGITLILDKEKHAEPIAKIQAEIDRRVAELKVKKLGDDKVCLKDGDETEIDYYQGRYTIKATNKKAPKVYNEDKMRIGEDDQQEIYGGCFVDAVIDLWTQNNSWGKRVNANIYLVRKVGDGEPIGGVNVDIDSFDDLL